MLSACLWADSRESDVCVCVCVRVLTSYCATRFLCLSGRRVNIVPCILARTDTPNSPLPPCTSPSSRPPFNQRNGLSPGKGEEGRRRREWGRLWLRKWYGLIETDRLEVEKLWGEGGGRKGCTYTTSELGEGSRKEKKMSESGSTVFDRFKTTSLCVRH